MLYWIFLTLAIITEIIGTLSMKYAVLSDGITGHIVMYIMITCSYILLAVAIKKIALGVAYALWEGIGALIITGFSIVLFDESMSVLKGLGLLVLLLGIALVKSGTKKKTITTPPINKTYNTKIRGE